MITHFTDWQCHTLRHEDALGGVHCDYCGCPLGPGDRVLIDEVSADLVCGSRCRVGLDRHNADKISRARVGRI